MSPESVALMADYQTWRTPAEAEALDALVIMCIQYATNRYGEIDTYGVRSVDSAMQVLEKYGLIENVEEPIKGVPFAKWKFKRLNDGRISALDDFIRQDCIDGCLHHGGGQGGGT